MDRGYRVCLLINDNELDREIFSSVVENYLPQMVCCVTSNAQDALAMILDDKIVPDIIFVELEMPKMNGVQFLKRLHKSPSLRHIPTIVHSNTKRIREIKKIKAAGATAIYPRPYRYQSVFNMLFIYQLPELVLLHPN